MKNQYFADRKDLYKLDLALELMEKVPGLSQFVYVAMLTGRDGTAHGSDTRYRRRSRRATLHAFLRERVERGERDVGRLSDFMRGMQFRYRPFLEPFEAPHRETYFRTVLRARLNRALILLDPDTGLEPEGRRPGRSERHVTEDEVRAVHERMGRDSVLALIQFRDLNQTARAHFGAVTDRLGRVARPGRCVCFAANGNLAFLILTTSGDRAGQVTRVLDDYGLRVGRYRPRA